MDFRTELTIKPSAYKMDVRDPVITIGSCFAQAMGEKLVTNKFTTTVNPFGTLYHPVSICKALSFAVSQTNPSDDTYLEQNGIFFNYDFHSSFSSNHLIGLKKQIEDQITHVHHALKTCRVVIMTFGTSFLYEHLETGNRVANCHKVPSSKFAKHLSEVDHVVGIVSSTIEEISEKISQDMRFILTVSPVRHTRDTLELNQVSKSVLRIACHKLAVKYSNVEYFPSYEIMMDDLRDYRFYKGDLIHPTETAEDYIWETFTATYLTPTALEILKRWNEVRKSLSHRPFHIQGDGHQKFLRETLSHLEELKSSINVEQEINSIRSQIT